MKWLKRLVDEQPRSSVPRLIGFIFKSLLTSLFLLLAFFIFVAAALPSHSTTDTALLLIFGVCSLLFPAYVLYAFIRRRRIARKVKTELQEEAGPASVERWGLRDKIATYISLAWGSLFCLQQLWSTLKPGHPRMSSLDLLADLACVAVLYWTSRLLLTLSRR